MALLPCPSLRQEGRCGDYGLKRGLNTLPRIVPWLEHADNAAVAKAPLPSLLLAAFGSKDAPGWLHALGEFRNEMVHTQPISANPRAAAMALLETDFPDGQPVRTLRLVPMDQAPEGRDPFVEIVLYYNQFERLAQAAAEVAPYAVELPLYTGR